MRETSPEIHESGPALWRVLEPFSSKWTTMVLHTLQPRHGGTCSTGDLQRSLPGISKMARPVTARWQGLPQSSLRW